MIDSFRRDISITVYHVEIKRFMRWGNLLDIITSIVFIDVLYVLSTKQVHNDELKVKTRDNKKYEYDEWSGVLHTIIYYKFH